MRPPMRCFRNLEQGCKSAGLMMIAILMASSLSTMLVQCERGDSRWHGAESMCERAMVATLTLAPQTAAEPCPGR